MEAGPTVQPAEVEMEGGVVIRHMIRRRQCRRESRMWRGRERIVSRSLCR